MDNALVQAVADELLRRLEPHLNKTTAANELEYLKLNEVARRTAFSYDFVFDAVTKGDLPATKKGREWRVSVQDLRGWMERDRGAEPTPRRSALLDKAREMMPGLQK